MSIARKSAYDFASRLGILVITMLTGIVLNRMVGAAGRGAYVLATVVVLTQLQNFASLGIQVSNQVLVGRDRESLGRLHAWAVVLALTVQAVFGGLVWLFRAPLLEGVFRGITPWHLALATCAVGSSFYWMAWQGLMIGLGDIRTLARFHFYLALLQNACIIVVLGIAQPLVHPGRMAGTVDVLVGIFLAIQILSVAGMALVLRRHGALWGPLEGERLRRLLSFGTRVYVGNVASGLLSQLDQLLVNGLAGIGALGVYNQAASLANKVWLVSSGIESAAYNPMTSATKEQARALAVDLFRVTFLLSLGLIALGWIAAPLIPWIYGRDFESAVFPFRLLILGTAMFGCGRMISMYFTGFKQSPQTLLVLNWVLLPIHANLCLWLIPTRGIRGACLATTITYTLSVTVLLVLFWRDGPAPRLRHLFVPRADDFRRLRRLWKRSD